MAVYGWFTHEKIVIFHSYVSLPEGIFQLLLAYPPQHILERGPKRAHAPKALKLEQKSRRSHPPKHPKVPVAVVTVFVTK